MSSGVKYTLGFDVLDGFSAPFRSATRASELLKEKIKGTEREARDLKSLSRVARDAVSLTEKVSATSKALAGAKDRVEELEAGLKGVANPSRKMVVELEKARAAVVQATANHDRHSNSLDKASAHLRKYGYDTRNLAGSQRQLADALDQSNARLQDQRRRLKGLDAAQAARTDNASKRAEVRGQIFETAGLAYAMSRPIMRAVEFESSFADVAKVVDFGQGEAGDAAQAAFSRRMLALSGDLGGQRVEGYNEIVAAAGQSGVAKNADGTDNIDGLVEFTVDAAKMSVAFDQTAAVAGETMAAWRSSMRLNQAEAVALADATNHLSNKMNAKAGDIAAVLGRQGATAMTAGLDEIQVASLSAALLSGGASEEVAATALKNITGALMKGDQVTARQSEAWSKLGFDPQVLAQSMVDDAPRTIIEVFEALQDVPEAEVSAVVSALFGEEVKGSVAPLLKNLDNLRGAFKLTADASEYAGSMEKEYASRSATRAHAIQRLANKWDRVSIVLGNLMLPALDNVMEPIAGFADVLASAAETYPAVAEGLMTVGAGLVAMKVGALALRFVGLQFGQGFNVLRSSRAKLNATTGGTASAARRAAAALSGFNDVLSRVGRSRGSGLRDRSAGLARSGSSFRRRGGRLGRVLGGVGAFTALGGAGASGAGLVADVADGLSSLGSVSKTAVGGLAAKVFRPISLLAGAVELSGALSSGSAADIGGASGGLLGNAGGMAAGAALGSMVFPGIGTAIGAIAGGIGGDALGEWIGSAVGGLWGDGKKSGDKPVAQAASQRSEANVNFSPTINVQANTAQDADQIAQVVLAQVEHAFSSVMPAAGIRGGASSSLGDGVVMP